MAIDFYFWANQKHRKLLAEALDDDKRAIKERAKLLSKKPPKPKKKQRQAAARQISYAAITHKLVSAPIIDEDDEHDPDALPKFIDLGVRIQLESGEWWFHHWRTGSWTHHKPGPPQTYNSLRVVTDLANKVVREPERILRYADDKDLTARMKHCLSLVIALFRERAAAKEELEARRV